MKFDVNRIMDAIMILTESYVSNIDDIAIQEKTRLDQVEETIRRHDGQWTKEYCDQYRREHGTDRAAIDRKMRTRREAVFPRMMFLLDQLHQWTDAVFDGMPSSDFMGAISLYRTMGMKLSKHELELLEGKVKNYAERKLFNAFSEECGVRPTIQTPNIEEIQRDVDAIEMTAKSCLNFYSGPDQILFDCIDQSDTMTPRNKITTMALGRTATDRKRLDDVATKINRAANIRELTEAESEKVMKIVEARKISDSALQNAIDGADPDVKMLIGMSDFGDRLKVIA